MAAESTWTPSRGVTRAAAAVLVALALSVVLAAAMGEGTSGAPGGRLGGDLPEFYGAGRIVRAGDADQLYEPARQAASQVDLHGDEPGYLDFAYPPVVAAVYAPLSLIPYRLAYLVHVAVMVAALWLALRLVRPMLGISRDNDIVLLAVAVGFFPMFRAITGGQNTALTVLCLAGAWRALHDDRELLAGVWLGAMFFKPQMAVLFVAAQLITPRWRVVAGIGLSGAVLWVSSAVTMGIGWLGPFLRHGLGVPAGDGSVGGGGSVSLVGTAQRFSGPVEDALLAVAIAASGLIAVTCLVVCRRLRRADPRQVAGGPVGLGLAVLTAGTVLAAPHVIFYDAGILVVVGLFALVRPAPRIGTWLVLAAVAGTAGALDSLPVNPLVVLEVVVLLWVLRQAHGRSSQSSRVLEADHAAPVPCTAGDEDR